MIARVPNDATSLEIAVRSNQEVPPGGEKLQSIVGAVSSKMINDNRQIVLRASVGSSQTPTVFRVDPTGLTAIATTGQESLPGETWLGLAGGPYGVDSSGRTLIFGLSGTSGNGMFLGDGTTMTPLLFDMANIPDGPGQARTSIGQTIGRP